MITDLEKVNNNWIYQSNKLIRLLASMIHKDDVDFKEYQFKAIDLGKVLGIHQKNIYKELDLISDKLMTRFIKIKSDTIGDFDKYHLIKTAKLRKGTGIFIIKIDSEVKEFYLQLKQYTKYQLKNILKFKYTYSFRVYELLKQYEGIRQREFTIKDLKNILEIEDKLYPNYSNFKQKIIHTSQKEINLNTDISFDFKEIKTGRKVTGIKFFIKPNKGNIQTKDKVSATIAGNLTLEEENYITVYIKTVQAIFREDITEKDAKALLTVAKGNVNIIKEKYDLPRKSDIINVVGWIRDAIKGDYKVPKGKSNIVGAFNDYEQRKYEFGKLEATLLGKNDGKSSDEESMSWEEQLIEYKESKPSEPPTAV
jgi:plasmid replication initiation protein